MVFVIRPDFRKLLWSLSSWIWLVKVVIYFRMLQIFPRLSVHWELQTKRSSLVRLGTEVLTICCKAPLFFQASYACPSGCTASSCVACPAGFYASSGQSTCSACALGTYGDAQAYALTSAAAACLNCPVGSYSRWKAFFVDVIVRS